jgi:hypothetical protein
MGKIGPGGTAGEASKRRSISSGWRMSSLMDMCSLSSSEIVLSSCMGASWRESIDAPMVPFSGEGEVSGRTSSLNSSGVSAGWMGLLAGSSKENKMSEAFCFDFSRLAKLGISKARRALFLVGSRPLGIEWSFDSEVLAPKLATDKAREEGMKASSCKAVAVICGLKLNVLGGRGSDLGRQF